VPASVSKTAATSRLDYIDSLRGFAAYYIVLYHLALLPDPDLKVPLWAREFVLSGGTGVSLFFVISSFTLYLTMDRRDYEPQKIVSFYLRRFFRIAPLFYLWLVLSIFRDWYFYNHINSINKIILNILFGFNFFPTHYQGIVWASWILGVQMIFYLIFPIIYHFVNNIRKAAIFFLIALLIAQQFEMILNYLHISKELQASFHQMNFLHQLPVFAAGIFTYYFYKHYIYNRKLPKTIGIGLIFFSLYLYIALISGKLKVLLEGIYWQGIIYSCLLLGLSIYQPVLLVNRFTVFSGKISYSLYLNHPTLIVLLGSVFVYVNDLKLLTTFQFGICFLFTAVPLFCISVITHKFIETPGMVLGKKIVDFIKSKKILTT
jgi:peptidoglycan/LPS O-acetylase OafA/YrhL